jgi:hypothetical protein
LVAANVDGKQNVVTKDASKNVTGGTTYGNETANAILGYSIEVGAGGTVETAQRR